MVDVPDVERELLVPRHRVAAVHLRPAGDPRSHLVAARLLRRVQRQVLHEQRTRADQAHVAVQHVDAARGARRGSCGAASGRGAVSRSASGSSSPSASRAVGHGAELQHLERAAVAARALLAEQHRRTHAQAHQQRHAPRAAATAARARPPRPTTSIARLTRRQVHRRAIASDAEPVDGGARARRAARWARRRGTARAGGWSRPASASRRRRASRRARRSTAVPSTCSSSAISVEQVGAAAEREVHRAVGDVTRRAIASAITSVTVSTKVKSRLCRPSPCTMSGRPASAASTNAGTTAAYAWPAACSGPNTLKKRNASTGTPNDVLVRERVRLGGELARRVGAERQGGEVFVLGQGGVGAVHRRRRRHDHVRVAADGGPLRAPRPCRWRWRGATPSDRRCERGTDGRAARCTTAAAPVDRVVEGRGIEDGALDEAWRRGRARLSRRPVERSSRATTSWPAGGEPAAEVGADETGTAGDEHVHDEQGYNGSGSRSEACRTVGSVPPVTRLFLSPPDVGAAERELLLDAFDSNWIAPLGPHVDAFEREFADVRRRAARGGAVERHRGVAPRAAPARRRPRRRRARAHAHVRRHRQRGHVRRARGRCSSTATRPPGTSTRRSSPRSSTSARAPAGSRPRCSASTSTGSAPTGRRSLDVVRAPRRAGDRGRGRGARRDVPRARRPARSASSACSRSTATRSSPRAAAACWWPTSAERDRAGALPRAPRRAIPRRTTSTREIGFNYRMSNLLAAVGRGQLASLPGKVARRRAIKQRVPRGVRRASPGIGFMPDAPERRAHQLAHGDHRRRGRVRRVARRGCASTSSRSTSRPARRGSRCTCSRCSPAHPCRGGAVAEEIFRTGLCLPSGSAMTDADVDRVVARGPRRPPLSPARLASTGRDSRARLTPSGIIDVSRRAGVG